MTATPSIPADIMAAGDDAVIFYLYLVEDKGESESISTMLTLRQAPRVMTDDVMMQGVQTISHMYERDPEGTDRLCKIAMKRGYRPRCSDFYNGAMAVCEGDPMAFLNHGQGRGHIKKVLESRGMASNGGLVTVKSREPESDPHDKKNNVPLASSLVEEIRKKRIRRNPDLKHTNQRELREEIVDTHGAK
jgi:hypothetical protein